MPFKVIDSIGLADCSNAFATLLWQSLRLLASLFCQFSPPQACESLAHALESCQ